MSVLTGQRLEDPIKHGEENAECTIDCGDFKAIKKWTAKGEYIRIVMPNGDVKSKPMEFLGGIVGKISFDPMDFKNKSPKDQRELLKNLVGLDFTAIDKEYKDIFEKRSIVNSNIKGTVAQLEQAEAPHPDMPDTEISFKDELEKLNVLRDKKKSFDEVQSSRIQIKSDIQDTGDNITEWKEEIKEIQNKILRAEGSMKALEVTLNAIVLPPEVTENEITAVESSLQDIEVKNVSIRSASRYRKLVKDSEKLRKDADALSQSLLRLEQDKSTRIANAPMPIEGMAISDDAVTYKGEPFTNLSEGQQIRVSTAMAMALNPDLKIIFIRQWGALDKDGKKEVTDLARAKGYDIWAEVVDESGELGYFIEDGEVSRVDGKEVIKEDKQTASATQP